jgi:YbgC/YbaW family acyl-CoA thioester hydrolase
MYEFKTKVYYEDTDSGGVVYYANYLKFIERARTNLIQELGYSLKSLSENMIVILSSKIFTVIISNLQN